MIQLVGFFRGINVGGNKKVPMAELKKTFESMGFKNIRTVLASGNIIFESKTESLPALTKKISSELERIFGFTVPTILKAREELENYAASQPFKGIKVTKDTRFYITFLIDESKSTLPLPYISEDKSFTILKIAGKAVFSVLELGKSGTPEAMGILEKEFGKNITTRNWNTINKILG